jgi:Amt family ammonium transporter
LHQIFASHAVGGIVGNLLTGLFAQASVAGFDGVATIKGGWLDHHYIQLGYQLADSTAGVTYSFVVTVSISLSLYFVFG